MSEGLAKTVTAQEPVIVPQAKTTQPISEVKEIIHDEVYKFFNITPYDNFNKSHLSTLSKWAMEEGSVGTGLKKLMSLELKLGAPALGESRISKLYNWVRLSENINSVRKEMDNELKTVKERTKNSITEMKGDFENRLKKIDSEIKTALSAYKKAEEHYKLNATESSKAIRNKYGKQLEELREMRTAFKGRR